MAKSDDDAHGAAPQYAVYVRSERDVNGNTRRGWLLYGSDRQLVGFLRGEGGVNSSHDFRAKFDELLRPSMINDVGDPIMINAENFDSYVERFDA